MILNLRAVAAAALLMPALTMAGLASETRVSGPGTCSVETDGGAGPQTFSNCRIISEIDDNLSIFTAEGFEVSFTGNAMEDTEIAQGSDLYARVENEQAWCYESATVGYSICFQPAIN